MKWEKVPTGVSDLVEYHLTDNEQTKLSVKYNTLQHSVRVYSDDERRLFFLHQHPGILRSKTVFTNEYGVEIGKLSTEKWYSNHYTVELEGKKFHITYRNNPLAEIVLYKKNIHEPLITCGISFNDNTPVINFHAEEDDEVSSLLLALCWYLYLPVARENVPAYA